MNNIFQKLFFITFWGFITLYDVANSSSYQSFNNIISPIPSTLAPSIPFLSENSKLLDSDFVPVSLEKTPSPPPEETNKDKTSASSNLEPSSQWSTTTKSIIFVTAGSFVCIAIIGGGIGLYWWLCQGSTSEACLAFMSTG